MTSSTELLTTRLSRNWLAKMGVFLVVLLVFGTWGLVDATLIYPKRGLQDASFKLRNYLQKCADSNRLAVSNVRVEDPARVLAELAARETKQQRSKSSGPSTETLTELESAKLAWLRALDRVWKLSAAEVPVCQVKRTKRDAAGNEIYAGIGGSTEPQKETHQVYFKARDGMGRSVGTGDSSKDLSPDAVLKDLNDFWGTTKATPSALEFYDLPSQWIFVVIGYGGAAYILLLLVRARSKKFQFAPMENRLVLPGGESIIPADLKDIDKRRWHKFFVTLNLKSDKSISLDLLRYVPLEEWILKMEQVAFPESSESGSPEGGDPAADEATGAASPGTIGKVSSMTYGGVFDGSFGVLIFERPTDMSDSQYAAYVQGEALNALGAALAPEGGWQLWLTACRGPLGGRAARVGGGPSLGIRNLADWLTGKAFGYQVDASRLDPKCAEYIRTSATSAAPEPSVPYMLCVGRVSDAAAARLHETMLDPPVQGYRGMLIVRSNPAAIERIGEPLELEQGLEIKGNVCKGPWVATAEEIDQAGLVVEEQPGA